MSHSGRNPLTKKLLLQPRRLISGLRDMRRSQDDGEERENLVVGGPLVPQSLHHPSLPFQLQAGSFPISDLDSITLLQRYAQIAQELLPSLPSSCPPLSPDDVKLTDERPVAAGWFVDIFEATYGNRKVVLKAYRCYTSFDVARVVARFCNEVYACSLLPRADMSFVGVYSTNAHPFGLVYGYMDNLDLRQYMKGEPNVRRLKLLTDIARCLNRLHGVGIVHGDLWMVNILVDKSGIPLIASLGSVHILHHYTTWTVESGPGNGRLSRSCAPELAGPGFPPNGSDSTLPTKASDLHSFGVMAFEILTGRPPFDGMTEIAVAYLMLRGDRPPRPDHHKVSGSVWQMIQSCWNPVASRRMPIEEVVTLLEVELSRIPTPSV
ncbi:kinase-like protein [Thelephora ganbajun]|uniref:Kinase-like protein n=1 Tax=Thelephora ganbajun TaxID=370292 RepID=A0ACB6ZCF8_THEGA|nr:kinase-like protein [Thelephora ganbajun]